MVHERKIIVLGKVNYLETFLIIYYLLSNIDNTRLQIKLMIYKTKTQMDDKKIFK